MGDDPLTTFDEPDWCPVCGSDLIGGRCPDCQAPRQRARPKPRDGTIHLVPAPPAKADNWGEIVKACVLTAAVITTAVFTLSVVVVGYVVLGLAALVRAVRHRMGR